MYRSDSTLLFSADCREIRSLHALRFFVPTSTRFHIPLIMALKLLVNASLLVIPIGGSLGALFGIDAHRSATGQPPLFSGDSDSNDGSTGGHTGGSTGGGSGADGSTTNNGITNSKYCQPSYGISPPSDGQLYTRKFLSARRDRRLKLTIPTVNPNQWGVTSTSVGALCMNVSTSAILSPVSLFTLPR